MASESLYGYIKRLEADIKAMFATSTGDAVDKAANNSMQAIKHELADTRLDIRDYEYAQTRSEQLEARTHGRNRLTQLRQDILSASQRGIFSSIDIARFSAQIDYLFDHLE